MTMLQPSRDEIRDRRRRRLLFLYALSALAIVWVVGSAMLFGVGTKILDLLGLA